MLPARSSGGLILRASNGMWAKNCGTATTPCCSGAADDARVPWSIDNSSLTNVDWMGLTDPTLWTFDTGTPDPKNSITGTGNLSFQHTGPGSLHRWMQQRFYAPTGNFTDPYGNERIDIDEDAVWTSLEVSLLCTGPGSPNPVFAVYVGFASSTNSDGDYGGKVYTHSEQRALYSVVGDAEARSEWDFAGSATGQFSCVLGMPSGSISIPIAYTGTTSDGMPSHPVSLGSIILTLSP